MKNLLYYLPLCLIIALSCSKETDNSNFQNNSQPLIKSNSVSDSKDKTGDPTTAKWGLNNLLRTDASGPGSVSCIRCWGVCNCYDVFYVRGMADLEKAQFLELIDAINLGETVEYFGDVSNEPKWNSIFQGELSEEAVSDLQDGITKLITFTEDEGENYYIAVQYADGSEHPGY